MLLIYIVIYTIDKRTHTYNMFYFIRVFQLQVSNMENTVMSLTGASTGDATIEIVSAFAIY